jgi:hypothetical protein
VGRNDGGIGGGGDWPIIWKEEINVCHGDGKIGGEERQDEEKWRVVQEGSRKGAGRAMRTVIIPL